MLKTENPVYCSKADCLILIKESGWEPNWEKEGILALLKSGSLLKRALLKSFEKRKKLLGFVEKSGLGLVEYLCWKRF